MKTLIERATDKGWLINTGTLQANGLFNAIRNNAATDNDITMWCASKNDAAREALRMHAETVKNKPIKRKRWTVYDPHTRQYMSVFEGSNMTWHHNKEKAYAFDTKSDATGALYTCGYIPTRYVLAAHEVRA